MSCSEDNPCPQTNSCYDDCGCLYPNTFKCTTYGGDPLTNLGVVDGDNGNEILESLDTKIGDILDNKGKSLVDVDDTCPQFLFDKLEAGLNISLSLVGSGCNRKVKIDAVDGGTPIDVNVKVSLNDTTSGYLFSKIDTGSAISKNIINPSGNEKVKLDIVISELLSSDSGNMLTLGGDGKLKTSYTAPDGSETKIVEGSGITITGTGITSDPYVISTNPSIQAARNCFDGIWRDVTLVATGNANVVYVSGTPKFRYRFDGSIEFKGQATYTVSFGTYSSSNRKFTITIGNIPTTCVTLTEQAGTSDLKGINYIDTPQASADQIVQQYGYIVRKSAQNVIVEFQSSFTGATTKTIVVNFDGVISHPNI